MIVAVRVLQDIWTRELGEYEACMSLHVESREAILVNAGRSAARMLSYLDAGRVRYGVLTNWSKENYAGFKALAGRGFTLYAPPGPTHKLERLGFRVVTVEEEARVGGGVILTMGGERYGESEAALIVESPLGPVILAGCGVAGALRLLEEAVSVVGSRPSLVVGGLIVRGRGDADAVKRLVEVGVCMPERIRGMVDDMLLGEIRDKLCWVSPGSTILVE